MELKGEGVNVRVADMRETWESQNQKGEGKHVLLGLK